MCVCVYIYIYIGICVCVCIYICVCVYIYMCVCVYICVCVCVCKDVGWCIWLKHCATSWKFASSVPDLSLEFFVDNTSVHTMALG